MEGQSLCGQVGGGPRLAVDDAEDLLDLRSQLPQVRRGQHDLPPGGDDVFDNQQTLAGDSKRYLSKYWSLVWPDRRANSPVR